MIQEQPIRVALVEDQEEIRESLADKIRQTETMRLVSTYATGEDAYLGLPNDQPDVVLMDIGLRSMNGIECMLRVKLKAPDIGFIMFTVFDNDEKVFDALKAGASGYVLKRDGFKGALAAVEEFQKGGAPMSKAIARKVLDSFYRQGSGNPVLEKLTPRQIEILNLLAKGRLYKEIAEELNPPITVGSLKQHINRIYKKLEVNNRTEALNKYLGKD